MKTRSEICPTIEQTALRMKREIATDVIEGRVPDDVPHFAALHDYVDANEYGGMCEEGMPERFEDANDWISHAEAAQAIADTWIRGGMLMDFPFVYVAAKKAAA